MPDDLKHHLLTLMGDSYTLKGLSDEEFAVLKGDVEEMGVVRVNSLIEVLLKF